MARQWVVVRPFGTYRVGDVIVDADEAGRVCAGELVGHVVAVEVWVDEPAGAPEKASEQ